MKLTKLAISCGGTGGHFFPGLSIARKFNSQGGEAILLLSGVNSSTQKQLAETYNVKAIELPYMPSLRIKNFFKSIFGLIGGVIVARKELKNFSAQAVLGMGSFTLLPVIFAAKTLCMPCFLHDGNARIGKANRFLSIFSKILFVAFPPVNGNKCKCKVEYIGMPIRQEFLDATNLSKEEAIKEINKKFSSNFIADKKTILIFGGSQGASIFNKTLPNALKILNNADMQVIHLSGAGKVEETQDCYENCNFQHLVLSSCSDMPLLYKAVDLVVSRSGGSSVAEISSYGKASILVPYPYAKEDHQYDNAMVLGAKNASIVIRNEDFKEEKIMKIIQDLFLNPTKIENMNLKSQSDIHKKAAETIINKISAMIFSKHT